LFEVAERGSWFKPHCGGYIESFDEGEGRKVYG
jgi:hypothetical protein